MFEVKLIRVVFHKMKKGKCMSCRKNYLYIVIPLMMKLCILESASPDYSLTRAVKEGNVPLVEQLLKEGANPNIIDNDAYEPTLLMKAVSRNNRPVVDLLIKAGATVDPQSIKKEIASKLWSLRNIEQIRILQSLVSNRNKRRAILSFEENDRDDAITVPAYSVLQYGDIAIVSGEIIKNLVRFDKSLKTYFKEKIWTLFKHKDHELYVIIPYNIEKIDTLYGDYGFKNLLGPILEIESLKLTPLDPEQKVKIFTDIIDETSPNHPDKFIFAGHGTTGLVAALEVEFLGQFFRALAQIDTKFLYILSCNVAGQNLVSIQSYLQEVIEKELKDNLVQMEKYERAYEEGFAIKPPEITQKGIPYMIIVQATTDAPIRNLNFYDFFYNLDLALASKQQSKSIADVLKRFLKGIVNPESSLPSIRWPGTTTFFRAIDLGEMEIITWLRLQTLRHENLRKDSKELIILPIKEGTQYVQIFPSNLMDICIDIQEYKEPPATGIGYSKTSVPRFISKIPGAAQHFIGKIRFTTSAKDLYAAMDQFMKVGFFQALGVSAPITNKCWLIKSVEINVAGKRYDLDEFVINVGPGGNNYVCHYGTSHYGNVQINDDPVSFKHEIFKWMAAAALDRQALFQATAGQEDLATVLSEVLPAWGYTVKVKGQSIEIYLPQ